MDRNPGFPEALLVAGQDSLGVDLPGGFDNDGVFKVADGADNRTLQNCSSDRRHAEYREKSPDVLASVRQSHDLARQVENRGERGCTRESLDFTSVGAREKIGGEVREGAAIEKESQGEYWYRTGPSQMLFLKMGTIVFRVDLAPPEGSLQRENRGSQS